MVRESLNLELSVVCGHPDQQSSGWRGLPYGVGCTPMVRWMEGVLPAHAADETIKRAGAVEAGSVLLGLGFGVWGLGFGVWGLGFRI